jgi:PAS domain S-box-containing protein
VKSAPATLVIINDDATQLLLWSELLRIGGHKVQSYASAEKALGAIRSEVKPGLIITDLHMPGIDGWRFCRLLRSPEYAAFNKTPVLVISATFAGEDARQITAELGANAFLSSPFLPSELLKTVEQLLAGQTPVLTTRVLIVEDEDTISQALVRIFAAHGYEATAVRTASEALRRCRRESQELIILDYHLPDMPGDVLLDELVRTSPHSAVIMMTGDPRAELALDWMKRGARAYVHKPFDSEYLVTLGEKARREIAMLHIETRLEERTRDLREREERYRTLFENVTDALFVHSLQADGSPGRFLEVNDIACHLLGFSRPELLHLTPDEVMISTSAESLTSLNVELRQGQALVFERQLRTKDGRQVPVELHARAFTIEGHSAVLSLARDITERQQAEADRRRLAEQEHRMQKLESLGIIAGGIAHDFNNILLTILGNVELVMNDLAPYAPARECLLEVDKAARRATELSMNMLIYSGRCKFAPQPLNISELATEMRFTLEAALPRDLALCLDVQAHVPFVAADGALLRQIISNLLNNAAEAMGERKGEVVLRTGVMECDAAYLASTWLAEPLTPGPYVFLEVTDNGSGMDRETLARIFDPFFSTRFTGRGLGLAATLGAVRLHHGAIAVTSQPGSGSTFRVLLPITPAATVPATPPAADTWRGHGTVLLVDDEEAVRDLGSRMLQKLGFETLVAANGLEAVKQMAAQREQISAVILDLTMPEMDGVNTFAALQEIKPGVPILMCSGYDEQSAALSATSPGYAGFLQKPYQQAALRAKLRAALERPNTT